MSSGAHESDSCTCTFDILLFRYSSKAQGELSVVVAPVLRFIDVGFNASVRIEV